MSSVVRDVLAAVLAALEDVGDGWYLFGAQAALLRGSRRLTSDVDLTLLPGNTPTSVIVGRLSDHGIVLRVADVDDFVRQTRVLPLLHRVSGMPVDLVLGGPGLEQMFLEAAEPMQLGDLVIPVATAEHLIVMKLLAARPKDFEDALAIARAVSLDLDRIEPLVQAIAEGLGEDDIRAALAELRSRQARA